MIRVAFEPESAIHLARTLGWVSAQIGFVWIVLLIANRWLKLISAGRQYVILVGLQFAMGIALPVTFLSLPTVPLSLISHLPHSDRVARTVAALPKNVQPFKKTNPTATTDSTLPEQTKAIDLPVSVKAPLITVPQIDWQAVSPYLCWGYSAIVTILLIRLIVACHRGQQLMEISQAIEEIGILAAISKQARRMGLHYVPAFASCDVAVPCVVGFIRPMLLLPMVALSELSPEQIEMVIAHELAHIRRFDPIINILQRVIEVFLFFHPAIWYLSRQIQYTRECCCDDLVLNGGPPAIDYAVVLEKLARHVVARFTLQSIDSARPLLAATGRPSDLRLRVARLLKSEPVPLRGEPVRLSRNSTMTVTFITVILCVGLFRNLVSVASASPISAHTYPTHPLVAATPSSNPPILRGKTAAAILSGMKPLHMAVASGTSEEVTGLLKSGSGVNELTSQGWSPLAFAAYLGRQDMIAILIEAGADPNLPDHQQRTPLFAALGIGPAAMLGVRELPKVSTVEYLLAHGANVNSHDSAGITPLDDAAVRGLSEICSCLLNCGADVDSRDSMGRTPAEFACQSISSSCLQLLADSGADLSVRLNNGWSLFDTLGLQPRGAGPVQQEMVDCAEILKQHGLQPDLCAAVSLGLVEDVQYQLTKRSPNPLKSDNSYRNYTALDWAIKRRNASLCQMLIAAGADVNVTDAAGDNSLFHCAAAANGDTSIEKIILEAKPDVNHQNDRGETALFSVFHHADIVSAELLIQHGADTSLKDAEGRTAMSFTPKEISPANFQRLEALCATRN